MRKSFLFLNFILLSVLSLTAQKKDISVLTDAAADKIEPKTIAWRRDFHEHPELGNREFRTSKIIADHLRSLGIEVKEGVGKTGVVGTLRGAKPGPVIGLRADMDALPLVERVDLPFASKEKTAYNWQEVGVMHAFGLDSHIAFIMSVVVCLAVFRLVLLGMVDSNFQSHA